MSRSLARLGALAAVGTVGLAALTACGQGSSTEDAAGTGGSAGGTSTGASRVAITMTGDGGGDTCTADTTEVPAGPVTFTVANTSATGITEFELQQDERILGEKENLAPGLDPVSFTLTLDGGSYQLYCPGATQETTPFTVTGSAPSQGASTTQALLQEGAKSYGTYVADQVDSMVQGAERLQQAVDAGDLDQARTQYANARIFYERIESDVEGFVLPGFEPTDNRGNLDYLIDMRASNLDPAVGWHGFHAVERDLFGRDAITAQTKRYAAELVADVTKLSKLVATLQFKPEDLANGAAALLEEVQANKISGEEEAFSHLDLVDFAGDLEGAQQCFLNLREGLQKIDPTLTTTIQQRFDAVLTLLNTYQDPKALGGYVAYTPQLRAKAANPLSQSVQSLQDALSRLAEKVATA